VGKYLQPLGVRQWFSDPRTFKGFSGLRNPEEPLKVANMPLNNRCFFLKLDNPFF
jgi:hypothetical protein